ncbi:hypothetical protein [Roseburia sp. MSJ-14]|uniref:hypothetical protein n=1 Tax=Roseburia sp. MSJ-14 TaxID=2841514 RepID=UPI001C10A533|nr:hypothetical protein [Roseburia sp. MSJ-14]MBU5473691.1 hypothetical protein [Roseburia sp. MSJ-14]
MNSDENQPRMERYLKVGKGDQTKECIVIFEKRKILIRCIVDYIAGMTDRYAIEEYERLK